jgi:hypothetical protein
MRIAVFVPVFAAQPMGRNVTRFQHFQGDRVWFTGRIAARAEGGKHAVGPMAQQRLGHNAAGRVAGTKKQNVLHRAISRMAHHLYP